MKNNFPMIFDTHAHYNDKAFAKDLPQILARFPEAGVGRAVNVADTEESFAAVTALAKEYPFFYAAIGVHPSECADMTEETIEKEKKFLRVPKAVAIGEIGLDYHWDTPAREIQQKWFRRQLSLAEELDLPVIIHSRDAAQDTMEILTEFARERRNGDPENTHPLGVVHCYSYSAEQALQYVDMGFFIGVGGVSTFKNARRLKEAVRAVPQEAIVLETDCPYMAPEPHRGERNSSLYLPLVAAAVGELKGISAGAVIAQTEKNAEKLYRIPGTADD